ncbi:MAG: anti-sigma factor antagonist, partial [Spartobacteria bacterium]|nr:anti-sigma factor antagonist [Spartobacteria bacterium]
ILIAHEALVEADPRNAVRFQDVIEYLRQEISESPI